MPFKIIETIERGRRLIETVPSSWESDGMLYWPKKNLLSLKRNDEEKPKQDWKQLSCLLLRDNIVSYEAAEQEIALMSDATDSEKENKNPHKSKSVEIDFNKLMEIIQPSNSTNQTSPADDAASVCALDANTVILQNLSQPIYATNQTSPADDAASVCALDTNTVILQDLSQEHRNILEIADPQTKESTNVIQKIELLMEMVSTVSENQKVLFENQNNTLKALALLNTKLEAFITRTQGLVQHEYHESLSFKMLHNIEDLTAFEEQLKDPLMETKYIKELSIFCCEKKTGLNNAYILVDVMFDRKLMTHCSWGGGTKGEPKHCFKAFTKTIDLFLKVVRHYDKTFTKPICEEFFKNVLRHSTKRSIAKCVRDSSTKKKTKKSEAINKLQEMAGERSSNDSNLT